MCATYVQVSTLMRPLYSFEDLYESLTQDIVDMEAMFDLLEQAPAVQVSGFWRQPTCKLCHCSIAVPPTFAAYCLVCSNVAALESYPGRKSSATLGGVKPFPRTFLPLSCRIRRVPGTLWYLREQSHVRAWHLDTRLARSS